MQIFKKQHIVIKDDLDEINHVNNVRYVKWVNDIALEHWTQQTSEELRNQFYWVMVSHHIDYKSQAFLEDTLRLETYVLSSEGIKSVRKVDIYNDMTNQLLASSETTWCFMSHETNRITRIPDTIKTLFD